MMKTKTRSGSAVVDALLFFSSSSSSSPSCSEVVDDEDDDENAVALYAFQTLPKTRENTKRRKKSVKEEVVGVWKKNTRAWK